MSRQLPRDNVSMNDLQLAYLVKIVARGLVLVASTWEFQETSCQRARGTCTKAVLPSSEVPLLLKIQPRATHATYPGNLDGEPREGSAALATSFCHPQVA